MRVCFGNLVSFITFGWKAGHRISCTDSVFQLSMLQGSTTTDLNSLPFNNLARVTTVLYSYYCLSCLFTEAQINLCNKMEYSWFVILFHWWKQTPLDQLAIEPYWGLNGLMVFGMTPGGPLRKCYGSRTLFFAALHIWRHQISDSCLLIKTDNMALVSILTNSYSLY